MKTFKVQKNHIVNSPKHFTDLCAHIKKSGEELLDFNMQFANRAVEFVIHKQGQNWINDSIAWVKNKYQSKIVIVNLHSATAIPHIHVVVID